MVFYRVVSFQFSLCMEVTWNAKELIPKQHVTSNVLKVNWQMLVKSNVFAITTAPLVDGIEQNSYERRAFSALIQIQIQNIPVSDTDQN